MLRHLVMPVATLALANTGQFTRFVRAAMIETLRMDHVRTARAKGAGQGRIVLVHALRNAMIPVVTVMALSFGSLFSGALITETMFAQPGMGKMIYDAIQGNDFNLALTGLLFATLVTLLSNSRGRPGLRLARPADHAVSASGRRPGGVAVAAALAPVPRAPHGDGQPGDPAPAAGFVLAAWPLAQWLGVDPYETDLLSQYGPPSAAASARHRRCRAGRAGAADAGRADLAAGGRARHGGRAACSVCWSAWSPAISAAGSTRC